MESFIFLCKKVKLLKLVLFRFKWPRLETWAFQHQNRRRLLALSDTAKTQLVELFNFLFIHKRKSFSLKQCTVLDLAQASNLMQSKVVRCNAKC